MYCGVRDGLSTEHIIPYMMAGAYLLPASSCRKCAAITSKFEGNLSQTIFLGLRKRVKLQSRSNKNPSFKIVTVENGVEVEKEITADELPAVFITYKFEPPGLLRGLPYWVGIEHFRLQVVNISHSVSPAKRVNGKITIPSIPLNLMRLAAKIAHGFLHYSPEIQNSGYEPLLNDAILSGRFAPYYVGSPVNVYNFVAHHKVKEGERSLHWIGFEEITIEPDNIHNYLVAYIHLFPEFGGAQFEVVTARRKRQGHALQLQPVASHIPENDGSPVDMQTFDIIMKVQEDSVSFPPSEN